MKDIMDELTAVTRQTGTAQTPAGDGQTVALRRTYPAQISEVWDALTSAEPGYPNGGAVFHDTAVGIRKLSG